MARSAQATDDLEPAERQIEHDHVIIEFGEFDLLAAVEHLAGHVGALQVPLDAELGTLLDKQYSGHGYLPYQVLGGVRRRSRSVLARCPPGSSGGL